MSLVPKVRRIRSDEELEAVKAAAKADNDGCEMMTHLVEKDGQIVGGAHIGMMPVLMLWHDSQRIGARESIQLKHAYEALMEEKGAPSFIVLCNKNSPYNAHMKALGYRSIWDTQIFANQP